MSLIAALNAAELAAPPAAGLGLLPVALVWLIDQAAREMAEAAPAANEVALDVDLPLQLPVLD